MSNSLPRGFVGSLGFFAGLLAALTTMCEREALAQKKHPAEGTARSIKSSFESNIEFDNQSQQIIKVFWLNLEGKREKGQTLNPGDRVTVKTYLNHPWVLTDDKDNALGLFYPDGDKRVVTYGQAKGNAGVGAKKKAGGKVVLPGVGKGKQKGVAVPPARLAYVEDATALEELKVKADQAAKLKAINAKYKDDLQAISKQALTVAKKNKMTAALQQESDRDIANTLDPAQNKRIEQMARQDEGAALFTDKTLTDAIIFTPEQQAKINTIRAKLNQQIPPKWDGATKEEKAKCVQARKDALTDVKALLTADQRTIWAELVGEPWSGWVSEPGLPAPGLGKGAKKKAP